MEKSAANMGLWDKDEQDEPLHHESHTPHHARRPFTLPKTDEDVKRPAAANAEEEEEDDDDEEDSVNGNGSVNENDTWLPPIIDP